MMYNCIVFFDLKKTNPFLPGAGFKIGSKTPPNSIKSRRNLLHVSVSICILNKTSSTGSRMNIGLRSNIQGFQVGNIHNMDEKGARIGCRTGEEVVVPISIKEIYTGVPENRKSLTVIESVSADGKAIPPVIIVPG
jgi:hypothetical protein